ncbi:MAG TPA: DUF2993 domain-containing protein [Armatimonadota bacterium]|nr:DUF2993 domain-containing protein [Armatimonadota bacterium]
MGRLFWVAILAVFVAGCSGGLIRPRVEKGIRNALPDYIGPAREYKVRADGSTSAMMRGLIEHLHIEGMDLQLEPKLLVSRISVDMDEVRYHPRTREIKSVRETTFEATLSEVAVNAYIEKNRQGESDLRVKLEPDKVTVEFIPRVAGVNVLVSVTGRPVIAGGDKVNFVADSASAAHLPVPAYVVNKMLERANPILDMSLMRFPVSLEDIAVKKNAVIVKGRAQFKPASPGS